MSIESIKSNLVKVAVGGVLRNLNLEQVLFVEVSTSPLPMTSLVTVSEGVTPASFTIEGDFRNLIAGIRPGSEPGALFGRFTDVATKKPIIVNLSKINRFIASNNITFGNYGVVATFTYDLLEPLANVMGNVGLSMYDVGVFSVNTIAGTQEFANIKNVTHQVKVTLNDWTTTFVDGTSVHYKESILDLAGV